MTGVAWGDGLAPPRLIVDEYVSVTDGEDTINLYRLRPGERLVSLETAGPGRYRIRILDEDDRPITIHCPWSRE